MKKFIVKRLLMTIVVLALVGLFAYLLVWMIPGDAAMAMLGPDATDIQLERLREELHLNDSVFIQYFIWLRNALHGNFGKSFLYNMDVLELVLSKAGITVHVGFAALILTALVGIPIGIVCAIRKDTWLDQVLSIFANFGMSAPSFWLAILGVYFLSYKAGLFPISNYVPLSEGFWASTRSIVLPAVALSLSPMASVVRQTRSAMLEVINQDYIRTAESKGVTSRRIIFRHALKNAMIPVITQLGMQVRTVIGGSVVVETVFNLPGVGRLLTQGVQTKDILLIQGSIMMIGLVVCIVNMLVDISYAYFNPKIRY